MIQGNPVSGPVINSDISFEILKMFRFEAGSFIGSDGVFLQTPFCR